EAAEIAHARDDDDLEPRSGTRRCPRLLRRLPTHERLSCRPEPILGQRRGKASPRQRPARRQDRRNSRGRPCMPDYAPPLAALRLALNEIVNLGDVAALPGCEQAAPDLVDQVLEEAAKLAGDVIAPLNVVGDRERSRLENGVVRTPKGFSDAYRSY